MKLVESGITPLDLGFSFQTWRKNQLEIAERVANSDKKVIILRWPTGGGKSVVPIIIQRTTGSRTLYVTESRILQAQYESLGIESIYGRDNYVCNRFPILSSAHGICRIGQPCGLRQGGCFYFDQKRKARDSSSAVLNYAYFLREANNAGEFSGYDCIVFDEAHALPNELSKAISVSLNYSDASRCGFKLPKHNLRSNISRWVAAASNSIKVLQGRVKHITNPDLLRVYINVLDSAIKISYIGGSESNWIIEADKNKVTFRPIWVDKIAKSYLWRHAKKFLLMSATIDMSICGELGLDPKEVEFIDAPSLFISSNRPIFIRPVVSVHRGILDYGPIVDAVASIVNSYPGRGIIHVTSYALCNAIASNSLLSSRVFGHTKDTRASAIETYKAIPGSVIVSPSLHEGIDLPYDLCTFQVIAKVPFPDRSDPVWQARLSTDRGKSLYIQETINKLVQAYGRGMRAQDDSCSTWIIDKNIIWLLQVHGRQFPDFFKKPIRLVP